MKKELESNLKMSKEVWYYDAKEKQSWKEKDEKEKMKKEREKKGIQKATIQKERGNNYKFRERRASSVLLPCVRK